MFARAYGPGILVGGSLVFEQLDMLPCGLFVFVACDSDETGRRCGGVVLTSTALPPKPLAPGCGGLCACEHGVRQHAQVIRALAWFSFIASSCRRSLRVVMLSRDIAVHSRRHVLPMRPSNDPSTHHLCTSHTCLCRSPLMADMSIFWSAIWTLLGMPLDSNDESDPRLNFPHPTRI